jgi:hypothetical protein
MKSRFVIIGRNWGVRISKIIKKLGYDATILPLSSPKNYKNYQIYKNELNRLLNTPQKKYDIVWVAIKPNKKILFDVSKICLENNFNLIIEKPWIVGRDKTNILKKIQKKMKLLVGFNFEYVYLNFFKSIIKNKNISKSTVSLNFYVKNDKLKNTHNIELGSHLLAIKKYFFSKNKNITINTGYKKNLRKIIIKIKNKKYEFDFTYNKEKIIQKFIKDYLHCLNKKKDFKLNFDFAKI